MLILGQIAYQKCLLISTSDQNLMKLSKQSTNDVRDSNVANYDGMKAQDQSELNTLAISNAISSNKHFR